MSRATLRLLLLTLIVAVVLAACGGATQPTSTEPKTITVALTEFKFQPSEITVGVGQPVKLVIKNNGTVKKLSELPTSHLPFFTMPGEMVKILAS